MVILVCLLLLLIAVVLFPSLRQKFSSGMIFFLVWIGFFGLCFFALFRDFADTSEPRTTLKSQGFVDAWFKAGPPTVATPEENKLQHFARENERLLIPYEGECPNLTKPPLYYWLATGSTLLQEDPAFISRITARMPALLFAFALLCLPLRGRHFFRERSSGAIFLLGLLGAPIFFSEIAVANVDGPLTASITFSLLAWFHFILERRRKFLAFGYWLLFCFMTTLALYFKGPATLEFTLPAMLGLAFFVWQHRKSQGKKSSAILSEMAWPAVGTLLGMLLAVTLFVAYYYLVSLTPTIAAKGGMGYLFSFFGEEAVASRLRGGEAEHAGPFYLIAGWFFGGGGFPAIFLGLTAIATLWYKIRTRKETPVPVAPDPANTPRNAFIFFLASWILGGGLILSLIPGKQPHYILPLLPPAAILAAMLLEDFLKKALPFHLGKFFSTLSAIASMAALSLGTAAILFWCLGVLDLKALPSLKIFSNWLLDDPEQMPGHLLLLAFALVPPIALGVRGLLDRRSKALDQPEERWDRLVLLALALFLTTVAWSALLTARELPLSPTRFAEEFHKTLSADLQAKATTYRYNKWHLWYALQRTEMPDIEESQALRDHPPELLLLNAREVFFREMPEKTWEILFPYQGDAAETGDPKALSEWKRFDQVRERLSLGTSLSARFLDANGQLLPATNQGWTLRLARPYLQSKRALLVLERNAE